jgi:hypothetical protein
MALPKLNDTPKYGMTIPSTGQEVRFRPFLVKEEKVLMLAAETEDQTLILEAITDTLAACIQEDIQMEKLTTFDVEYMFVTLRSKSVGETIDLKMICEKCETENEYKIKIDDLKVVKPKQDKIIILDENISIEMVWPTYKMVGANMNKDLKESDLVFNVLANCIQTVKTEEESFSLKDESQKDIHAFIESMDNLQFKKVQDWIELIPKLSHDVEYDCVKCETHNKTTLEGMQNFFT